MTMLRAKGEAEPAMWSQKVQRKSVESQNFRSPAGFQGNFLIGGHLKNSEGGHGVSVKIPNFQSENFQSNYRSNPDPAFRGSGIAMVGPYP